MSFKIMVGTGGRVLQKPHIKLGIVISTDRRRPKGILQFVEKLANRWRAFVIVVAIVFHWSAFGHAPYEVTQGAFVRSDGKTVYIVKRFTDGILGPDPASLHFRLSNGETITNTASARDTLRVRVRPGDVELFDFTSIGFQSESLSRGSTDIN
jgi:hypothetical protein